MVNQEEKKEGFNNPLISASDLNTGSYDRKIINNIYRFEGNDHWFCKNCAMKGDKWFMMKHPCNNINNNNNINNKIKLCGNHKKLKKLHNNYQL